MDESVHCKWCGNMTENTGAECDLCWELRKRMEAIPHLARCILDNIEGITSSSKDAFRLDFLQMLTDKAEYSGKVVLRISETNRGWRLHETHWPTAINNVRQAIDAFIEEYHYWQQYEDYYFGG